MHVCGGSARHLFVQFALAAIVVLPCAWGNDLYNYESYENTLNGPLGVRPTGVCESNLFVSTLMSISNCSLAPGVVGSADSLATNTAIHADSILTLTNATLLSGIEASSYARTVDTIDLRVSSSLGNTGVAYLGFTFDVDGTLVDSGLTDAGVTFGFGFNYDGGGVPGLSAYSCFPGGAIRIPSGSTTVSFTCSTPAYPVALFERYPYFFSLSSQETVASSAIPVSGSASSSFFNTLSIASVQPYDANMNFIPNAVISSVGNNGNPFVDEPVPEPSGFVLLASGFGMIAALKSGMKPRLRRR